MTRHPLIALILCSLLLAGCGQSGPLYLPEKDQQAKEQQKCEVNSSGETICVESSALSPKDKSHPSY